MPEQSKEPRPTTVISFDVDGVLRNLNDSIIKSYIRFYPYHASKIQPSNRWNSYKLEDHFPIGKKIYNFMYENSYEIFLNADIYPGAFDGIKALKKCGFNIIIISSQREDVQTFTDRWIDNHKLQPSAIYYTEDKHEMCGEFTYHVEDSPTQIVNIYEANGRPIIFDHPYNRNLPIDIEMNCYRVHSWAELVRHFLKDRVNEPLVKQIYKNFS